MPALLLLTWSSLLLMRLGASLHLICKQATAGCNGARAATELMICLYCCKSRCLAHVTCCIHGRLSRPRPCCLQQLPQTGGVGALEHPALAGALLLQAQGAGDPAQGGCRAVAHPCRVSAVTLRLRHYTDKLGRLRRRLCCRETQEAQAPPLGSKFEHRNPGAALETAKTQCRQTQGLLLRLCIGPVLSSWGTEREAAGVALQEEGEMGTPSSFKALHQIRAHKFAVKRQC